MSLNAATPASEATEKQEQVVAPNTADDTVPSWSIFVKTVGKGFDDRRVNDASSDKPGKHCSVDGSLSFQVTVSPEDEIDFLHGEIEGVTGVKASQQRLIYRGRLIGKSDVIASMSHTSGAGNDENSNTENSTACKEKASLATRKTAHEHEYKIKDIVGLCDGQTIHLVRKRDTNTKTKTNGSSSEAVDERGSRTNEMEDDASNNASSESETSVGGGALLAALLGLETRLGGGGEDGGSSGVGTVSPGTRSGVTNNTNRNGVQSTTPTSTRTPPWRSSRSSATANSDADTPSSRSPRHNRRPHYRLGTEDLEVSDPGSMESVRQGLMTLNTIMNSQPRQPNTHRSDGRGTADRDEQEQTHHPLEVNREWFRGQWIDARDTVNQWLEATVVDILDPRDVLNDTVALRDPTADAIHARRYGSTENPQQPPRQRRVPNVDNDPAISANDIEGRRRLLLEACEPGDPREIIIGTDTENDPSSLHLPGTNSSQSFRPRSSNKGVKLLLIHYNGWPHRWDEWIRSDSERLRPFRTRTRHPNTSSMASPTPQSIFNDAPRTNIIEDGDEDEDRFAVLPELNVVLSRVSDLLGEVVQREGRREDELEAIEELEDLHPPNARSANDSNGNCQRAKADLPWMARNSAGSSGDGANASAQRNRDESNEENESSLPSDEDPHSSESGRNCDVKASYSRGELRNLATLFDRLGRTLTDVAPHIASIAASLPAEEHENVSSSRGQNAPPTPESPSSYDYDTSSAPLGGLLSLWSRERERARRNTVNHETTTTRPTTSASPVDPDHIDFASGIVNTTRGEVRSGPRNRAAHQDDVASLLGTYLAAASLGSAASSNDDNASGATSSLARLLQRGSGGGSGDNGIDIHIHAIVTAPGVSPGGMGIATLSSGGSSPTATLGGARNIFSSSRSNIRADGGILRSGTSLSSNVAEPVVEEDYNDLFSELYSESPTPIDPNGSPVRGESEWGGESDSTPPPLVRRNTDDDVTENNCSSPTIGDNNTEPLESQEDAGLVTPRSNRSRSTPRRQSASRRSGVFRLFRRRGSRADAQDGPNHEET